MGILLAKLAELAGWLAGWSVTRLVRLERTKEESVRVTGEDVEGEGGGECGACMHICAGSESRAFSMSITGYLPTVQSLLSIYHASDRLIWCGLNS